MKSIAYKTKGTCSRQINVTVDDNDVIQSVEIIGGCEGNTHGIMSLVTGMKAKDVYSRLVGIKCGTKGTSCPDQLACALEQLYKE